MPLSEHEQREWERMTESLADDPKFASAVRSSDPRVRARRRLFLAVVIILAGLGLVVFGVVNGPRPLGVAGFVVMLAGAAVAMHPRRAKGATKLQAVDGTASRSTRRRSSLLDRLEERWRRRPEGNR